MLSETVKSVTVPGADGYFTVLGDHAPLMTTLKPGFVTVDGQCRRSATSTTCAAALPTCRPRG